MNFSPKISILDYGSGNLKSVLNILEYLGYDVQITRSVGLIDSSTHLILPGVGSYKNCIEKIKKNLGINLIKNQILEKQKPLLGICVGMQVLSSSGYENGDHEGLNLIEGKVVKLENTLLSVPQVGWNEIEIKKKIQYLMEFQINLNFTFYTVTNLRQNRKLMSCLLQIMKIISHP